MAKAKLGDGVRFKAVEAEVANEPGVRNPAAVAAAIGRKKYGAKRMAGMAKRGKQRLMLHQKIARGMSPRA